MNNNHEKSTEQSAVNSGDNTEYASQWIDYLKKKNSVLSIVWPVLLVSAMLCLIAALYFFQVNKTTDLRYHSVMSELQTVQQLHTALQDELSQLQNTNAELLTNNSILKQAKADLEQQKGNSVTELDLTGKIVEALKEELKGLTAEKEVILTALSEAKALLAKQQSNEKKAVAQLESQSEKTRLSLEKKLKNRKIAFDALVNRQKEMQAEMNRLADLSSVNTDKLDAAKKEKQQLEQKLKRSQQDFLTLQAAYNELDKSLKSALEPVSSGQSDVNDTARSENVPSDPINVPSNPKIELSSQDGLDEIRVPVKARQ